MVNRHGLLIALGVAASLLAPEGATAQPKTESARGREYTRYLVVSFGRQEIDGGFGGGQVVSSVKGFFAIPRVEVGTSSGIAVGVSTDLFGLEGGYRHATHPAAAGDVSGDGSWRALEIEGRVFAPYAGPVRFFAGGGMSLEWLSVDNAYCSDSTGMQCRARFEGLGFNAGAGALVRVYDRFFVSSRLAYRWTDYDTMESLEAGEGTLVYAVEAEGWVWTSGIGIEF